MKAACYVRVSSDDQIQGHSLGAQERAIRDYCRLREWEITGWYRDEGRSARSDVASKRPEYARLMADAVQERFDVVIVHKLDRFARNRRIAFDAFHVLGKAGVGFVSLSENMDYSTPSGQLMLTMLIGMAQFYSDNLAAETRKGKGERKKKGLYNGHLPFGSTKGPDGVPVLDTEPRWCDAATRTEIVPAEGLRLAFELAAAGKSDREIARVLSERGYRTTGTRGTNPFTKDTVRVILRNRFYLGELPDGQGGHVPGRHGALIDPVVFERAQVARTANTKPRWSKSATRSPWALSGVAACGRCGKPVVADGRGRVCCAGRSQGNGCAEPSYPARIVEEQIAAYLSAFAVPEEKRERFVTAWRRAQSQQVDVVARRRSLERKRDRLRNLYEEGDIDRAYYQEKKAKIAEELAALPTEGDPDSNAGTILAGFLANIGSAWTAATPDERNRLARQLFGQVVIANRTAVAVVPRPDLRPFFEMIGPEGKSSEADPDCSRSAPLPGRQSGAHQAVSGPLTEPAEVTGVGSARSKLSAGLARFAVPDLRSAQTFAATPTCQQPGVAVRRRYRHRLRKLTPNDEAAIKRLAGTRTLRLLAADFGVSHETIRSVLRR